LLDFLRELFRPDPFRGGTFAPFSLASLKPIAIACFRLFTFRPDPLFRVPFFCRCTADFTRFCADLPYFAIACRTHMTCRRVPGWALHLAVPTPCRLESGHISSARSCIMCAAPSADEVSTSSMSFKEVAPRWSARTFWTCRANSRARGGTVCLLAPISQRSRRRSSLKRASGDTWHLRTSFGFAVHNVSDNEPMGGKGVAQPKAEMSGTATWCVPGGMSSIPMVPEQACRSSSALEASRPSLA
jgi:hypothetical protein